MLLTENLGKKATTKTPRCLIRPQIVICFESRTFTCHCIILVQICFQQIVHILTCCPHGSQPQAQAATVSHNLEKQKQVQSSYNREQYSFR